jgi:AcrR family transcriptional regulator
MTSGTARRVRNPRGKGARLRDELVTAAGDLLTECGSPEHVSLRQVAEAVGVSAPSIYRHFPNKDALLLAVVEKRFEELRRVLGEARERGGDDPFAALGEMGRAYVAMGLERPAHYQVLFGPIGGAIQGLTGTSPPVVQFDPGDPGQGAFLILVELIEGCLAAGPNPDRFDAFVVAIETWSFVHGLVDLVAAHPGFPWPSIDAVLDSWVARFEQSVRCEATAR